MTKFLLNMNIIFALLAIALISSVAVFNPSTKAFGATSSIMNDTVASAGLSTWSGRPIHAENASDTSTLVGKNIDTIQVKLKKSGAPTGTGIIGVFNKDLTVKQQFGSSIDVSTIAGTYTYYTFSLPAGQSYKITAGDRIGFKFTGGDGTTNFVSVMTDRNNSFDGTNSYRIEYGTTWKNVLAEDLTMTLLLHDPPTVPGAPTGLTPTAGNAQVSLSWTAPSSNGGSPVTDYVVEFRTGVDSFAVFADGVSTGTSATVTGLTNGVSYDFRVSAVNSMGTSLPSAISSSTPLAPSTVPGAPTGLTPTAGNAQVSLSWTAPSSNGGSPITGYNIYRGTTSGGEAISPIAVVGPSITTYNNTGLTNGQQYFYTISAVNSVGPSAASNEASAIPVGILVSSLPVAGTYNSTQLVTLTASQPATIYYTIDGSTPTTSSTNGTSPISGIPITSNSTLKFFAKDSIGNNSTIYNKTYTIILPPTVSASPATGTYNSTQIVTLTASKPSIIYYTTDGSTPTKSSTNGPSPITGIQVKSTTTVKFFAKDSLGNISPTVTNNYTIILPPTVSASPASGTYSSSQLVTLTASKPATIYYTINGPNPTTSSTNGTNQITGIAITSNSTLKFFAKDSLGNISPTVTNNYTIILPPKPILPHYDGSKAVVSINFEHGFDNQYGAINANMSSMNGSIAVIAQRIGHTGYMTATQLHSLENRGFEIISHSETHLQITPDTPTSSLCYETIQSKIDLQNMGFKIYGMVPPFLYVTTQNFPLIVPNYNYTELIQNSPPQVGYNITFNTPQSINASKHDLGIYDIPTWGVGAGDAIRNFTAAKSLIDYAVAHKLMVDIHFHGIEYAGGTYDTTPELFTQIMSYVKQQKDNGNLLVLTHAQALNLVGIDTTVVIPPTSVCYGIVKFPPPPPTVVMNDNQQTIGLSLYSGRSLQTEYVSSNSVLVNKTINSITVMLKQTGSPTGKVYLGVFNQDRSIKKLIGTLDASLIKSKYTSYTVNLGVEDSPYQIHPGDYIGVKYTDGDAKNQLAIMTDQNGIFDGVGSYLSYYTTKWSQYPNQDLTMTLSLIQ